MWINAHVRVLLVLLAEKSSECSFLEGLPHSLGRLRDQHHLLLWRLKHINLLFIDSL